MYQLFLPYVKSMVYPYVCQATFCTNPQGHIIAFTTEEGVSLFVKEAERRLGLMLEWGIANEEEFPDLSRKAVDLDPRLPATLVLGSTPVLI